MTDLETRPGPTRASMVAQALAAVVGLYQRLPRPGVGCCRFAPTCSSYAREALLVHGALRGVVLTAWRLARCHPFHPGGIDRVPVAGLRGRALFRGGDRG